MGQTHWDSVFSGDEYHYGVQPNAWIREAITRIIIEGHPFASIGLNEPEMIRIVELAAGEGRNAAWLAAQGFDVTAIDRSTTGLEKASALAREQDSLLTTRNDDVIALSQTADAWRASTEVVISTFFHVPVSDKGAMLAAHREMVRPGGFVIAEWFHPDQRAGGYESGGPRDAEMLVTPEELRAAFDGWRIIDCRREQRELAEGAGHIGTGVVTRFAAQRPGTDDSYR